MTQDVYMGRTSQSDLAPPDPEAQTRRPRRTFLYEATKPTTRTFLLSQRGDYAICSLSTYSLHSERETKRRTTRRHCAVADDPHERSRRGLRPPSDGSARPRTPGAPAPARARLLLRRASRARSRVVATDDRGCRSRHRHGHLR